MNVDPLDVALRNVAEARHLLENLIISSESFDYPKAKLALTELRRKTRELARLQARWEKMRNRAENVEVVDFTKAARQAVR